MDNHWKIREPENIKKIMCQLGKPEKKRYFALIEEFKDKEPRSLAYEEITEKGIKYYFVKLNDSYRVKYTLYPNDPNGKIIAIVAIGDHKEVGLRE